VPQRAKQKQLTAKTRTVVRLVKGNCLPLDQLNRLNKGVYEKTSRQAKEKKLSGNANSSSGLRLSHLSQNIAQ
jgi:hypothetical protein